MTWAISIKGIPPAWRAQSPRECQTACLRIAVMIETEGMAWAWSIHFIQDVIIFSALLSFARNMAAVPKPESGQ